MAFSKIEELSKENEILLEKNISMFFCMPRTTQFAKKIPFKTEVMFEPLIGKHLGIVTDRRTEGLSTNKDIHNKRKDYFFSENYDEIWTLTFRKMILNRIFEQFQTLDTKISIIEHPSSNFGAEMIANCLPGSKIIVLILDGRLFIDSQVSTYLKTNSSSKTDLDSNEKNLSFIEQQAKRWLKMIQILRLLQTSHPKELFLEVKCEELITNTTDTLKKIYQFLDIKITEEDLINISHKIKKNENLIADSWKTNFSEKEKNLINNIIGKELKEFGYQV